MFQTELSIAIPETKECFPTHLTIFDGSQKKAIGTLPKCFGLELQYDENVTADLNRFYKWEDARNIIFIGVKWFLSVSDGRKILL